MKASILAVLFSIVSLTLASAQEEMPKPDLIYKGQSFLNLSLQSTRRRLPDQNFYRVPGLELGGGYYLSNRFALKAAVTGQQHLVQERFVPVNPEYNRRQLLLVTGQVRYNFWEMPGFVSLFLQSGYSYGRFTGAIPQAVNRWEILSAGETLTLQKAGLSQLALEIRAGLERDNLSQKLSVPAVFGLNYYLKPAR